MSLACPKSLNLKKFLPYQLSLVTNKISRNLGNIYAQRFDLSIAEWRVMAVLGEDSDLSADEVCLLTEMDKVTVSRAVTKLLDKNHIERKFSDQDRRRSILRLSRAGYAIYSQIVPQAVAFENDLLKGLSRQEQQQLNKILQKLKRQAIKLSQADPA